MQFCFNVSGHSRHKKSSGVCLPKHKCRPSALTPRKGLARFPGAVLPEEAGEPMKPGADSSEEAPD